MEQDCQKRKWFLLFDQITNKRHREDFCYQTWYLVKMKRIIRSGVGSKLRFHSILADNGVKGA